MKKRNEELNTLVMKVRVMKEKEKRNGVGRRGRKSEWSGGGGCVWMKRRYPIK